MLSIIFLNVIHLGKLTRAQDNGISLTYNRQFELLEFSTNTGSNESITAIQIPLPSSSWNVSQVTLNFTNIKLDRELQTIEENQTGAVVLDKDKKVQGYGVEINVTEYTTIFGVYIFGSVITENRLSPVYIQINGYDSVNDAPNQTEIHGQVELNISTDLGWHFQEFSIPVNLTVGQYFLVLNGTEILAADNSKYLWFFNDENPQYPDLHVSEYNGISWSLGQINNTFLYKIAQRTNKSYDPEDVDMTAHFNGDIYPISNGITPGTGYVIVDEEYSPQSEYLSIPFHNNQSVSLFFNLNYSIQIKNRFFSAGSLLAQDGHLNNWTLTPNFERCFWNYSVRFTFPNSWYNFYVYSDGQDITSQVLINSIDKYIYFPNDTIDFDSDWEITANSPNIGITINAPKTEFEPSQDLKFSVNPPIQPGNLTYYLSDPLDFKEHYEVVEISAVATEPILFSYRLSDNPNEGNYKAVVFWNNQTDAGITTQLFSVNIDYLPLIIATVSILAALIVVIGIISYTMRKRSKRRHEAYRLSIYNKYMDILNLDYLIIIEKKTGVNIYDQILAAKNLDATLISGFLEAIRSFGIELTGSGEQSQVIKLEYQNSKILMSEFKNFRLTLIMEDNPSQDFLESVKELSYEIDSQYGKLIEGFKGQTDEFAGMKELIEKHLPITLIYPLRIMKREDIKVKAEERAMIRKARTVMEEKNLDYFFVSTLFSDKKGFQIKDAETVLKLLEKKIFTPSIK